MEKKSLNPINSVYLVTANSVEYIDKEDISVDTIGQKAYGLTCLPAKWTYPFICLGSTLVKDCKNKTQIEILDVLALWRYNIERALELVFKNKIMEIIIRSSSVNEGLEERGQYYSKQTNINCFYESLSSCICNLISDKKTNLNSIPLIIQEYSKTVKSCGHLSNERRFYKETRDWVGEYEIPKAKEDNVFKINLRNWRNIIPVQKFVDRELACNLRLKIQNVLKIPATWAYLQNIRVHFEWVWDGDFVKIVQADYETDDLNAVNPKLIEFCKSRDDETVNLKCLKIIDENFSKKFKKIHNPILYRKLKLETRNLYILDNIRIINDLKIGVVNHLLSKDLENIIQTALVIRMDIKADDINVRQLLPRSDELRSVDEAIKWLVDNSKNEKFSNYDFVFIIHNFIPALASGFSYAAPNERIVQVEALWGIPEGLYYNAHDKYIIDTRNKDFLKIEPDQIGGFRTKFLTYAKKYFVSPDKNGKWNNHILQNEFIWKSTIQRKDTLRKIAFQSRAIAEKEQKHLSIMWFIGLDPNDSTTFMPWHHEEVDPGLIKVKRKNRQKRNFEKSFVINTINDVEEIKRRLKGSETHYSSLKIQPKDENLLRDKDTLQTIGELARANNIVIIMEGSILSHAYYQLCKTNAVVEVENPFKYEGEQNFNKLVRDKIPGNIASIGETVKIAEIKSDDFVNLLKRKMVEESFEALDAKDYDSLIGELADIKEIMDSLMKLLNISKDELYQSQKNKRRKAGGFEKGYVLLKTDNPIPIAISKPDNSDNDLILDINIDNIYGAEILEKESSIRKNWKDSQINNDTDILRARIRVPILKDKWKITTPTRNFSFSDMDLAIYTELVGNRVERDIQIDVLLNILQQKKLFKI